MVQNPNLIEAKKENKYIFVKKSGLQSFLASFHKNKYYYLLGLPAIILFIIYKYIPMFGIQIAFKDLSLTKGIFGSPWVGMKWFNMLFINDDFLLALRNTVIISLYKIVIAFPAPIILSIFINEVTHSGIKRTIQTFIYLPHFISWTVLAGIIITLTSPDTGIISLLGMDKSPLMSESMFRGFLVVSDIWKESGWGTIIYLAAITTINPELFEAGIIDGANRIQRIIYITLPSISSTIVVLFILRLGHVLNAGFDQVYMLYNPLVYRVGDILDTYVFRVGLGSGRLSMASAAGLFKSVVGLLLIICSNWVVKKIDSESGLW